MDGSDWSLDSVIVSRAFAMVETRLLGQVGADMLRELLRIPRK